MQVLMLMKEEQIAQKQDKKTDRKAKMQRQLHRSEETYKLNEIHKCNDVT